MKIIEKFSVAIFCLFLISCSSDNNSSSHQSSSRVVKYEVSSNSPGNFNVAYISDTGAGVSEDFTQVPWIKTFTAQADVVSVTMQTSVRNGTPGKNLIAKIYIGGVVKKQQTLVIQADGTAAIVLPSYVF